MFLKEYEEFSCGFSVGVDEDRGKAKDILKPDVKKKNNALASSN